MVDDPQGDDADDEGTAAGSSLPGDEIVEGIGGDPFPPSDAEPASGTPGAGSRAAIPQAWPDQAGPAGRSETFEPLAEPLGADAAVRPASEGEDSASHASQVQIGTGKSGIFSPSDILSEASSGSLRQPRSRWILAEDVADGQVEEPGAQRDRAAVPPGPDTTADPDEWRDIAPPPRDETASESIGFSAFLASTEAGEQAGAGDSLAGDSQGIVESSLEGLDLRATEPGERRAVRRDDGALRRQLVGVVLGGLLALPVTQAILLWGFHRDPFHVTKHVPGGLRFLLPTPFRGNGRRAEAVAAAPTATLDSLDSLDSSPSGSGDEAPPLATGDDGSGPVEAIGDAPAPPVFGVESGAGIAAVDSILAIEPPPIESLGESGPAVASDPGPLGERIAAALAATARLEASVVDRDDPAVLVAWYRELAEAASLLAAAERGPEAALTSAVDRFEPLAGRLAAGHARSLDGLGAMWLASATRPIDGAVLVGRLEEVRAVGPWWGGAVSVGSDDVRRVTFLCRGAPPAGVGERVLVAGVLVDPATMWVSVMRGVPPAAAPAGE